MCYTNETLGIGEGWYQLNSHFFPEGEEREVIVNGEPAIQVGYIEGELPQACVVFSHSPNCVVGVSVKNVCRKKK